MARASAIIVAAGRGTRMGGGVPKQWLDIGGRSILQRSVDVFDAHPAVGEIVVVVPAGSDGPALECRTPWRAVPGGARRQDSVAAGFRALASGQGVVLVHDAARPFADAPLVDRVIAAAAAHGAAVPALPVHDTVKRVDAGGRRVRETIPRDEVWLAQTPQGFRRDVLAAAIALGEGGVEATDEAMLAERAGHEVQVVEGSARNVKITTPGDLEAARHAAGGAAAASWRIGHGYDLHRLVQGRPLILGGVTIPFELGLAGHSDADIVCHAVTDAVLGAASLGDIGRLFPDTDAQWKDADSVRLLAGAMTHVHAAGYRVVNVDVTVVAERPKLLPHLDAIRANLARALAVDPAAVSVKGKTNEGVDSMGRQEAMACHAVALLAAAPGPITVNTETQRHGSTETKSSGPS